MLVREFFELDPAWQFKSYFSADECPIEWLKRLHAVLLDALPNFPDRLRRFPPNCHIDDDVFIHESVILPPICVIRGPTFIGQGTEIRPFAYIRGNVIVGKNCIIGSSCEVKHSILLNHVQVAHFNYVGDSVLGNFSHLGAGAICANLRLDKKEIVLHSCGDRMSTGMTKLGAIIGDSSEIACNVVLNPGTVLTKNSCIFGCQSGRKTHV